MLSSMYIIYIPHIVPIYNLAYTHVEPCYYLQMVVYIQVRSYNYQWLLTIYQAICDAFHSIFFIANKQ